MAREWTRLCKGAGFAIDGDEIEVRFADERHHRVRVDDEGDAFRVVGVVAQRAEVQRQENLALRAWRRNRSTQLVGFRLDDRGRLVGESWVPKAGLSGEEFAAYVRQVAAECDRFEYLLTGKDTE
ncbi:YbjN domain-containing protein [Sorangium sp. KYC3313]|uniref:YbjN domain-containing protein n=1 Tax=Sorangium sp. KYC3313 TaxID=3449740 RepID=UPI003F8BC2CD